MYCNKIDEMIIPNQNEFHSFYNTCVEKNNFNILCVGPRDSGKSTILHHVMNEWIKRDDKSLAFWDRFSKKYARRTYEEWLDIHTAESPCLRNSILNRLRDEVLRNDDLNDLVEKFD